MQKKNRQKFYPLTVVSGTLWSAGLLWLAFDAKASEDVETMTSGQGLQLEINAPANEYRQFNKVEITGSSIVRKEQTQALPVQVITREDIQRTGLKTVEEVLQALPLMSNYVTVAQLGAINGGYTSASVHGMPTGTLVLINGSRMAPYGRPTTVGPERSMVDVSVLPLVDIDRIEVLSDGASSLYGTDAIAGVVNIILRNERKGLEISADWMRPSGGQGQGKQVALSWGQGQLQRDGYSFLVSAEIQQQDELLGRDRPYAAAGRYEFATANQTYEIYGPKFTGNLFGTSPASFKQSSVLKFSSPFYVGGACTGNTVAQPRLGSYYGQPVCMPNFYSTLGIYPDKNHRALHARAARDLGEGHRAYLDVLYGDDKRSMAATPWTPTYSPIGLPAGSAAAQQALAAGLPPAKTYLGLYPDLPALRSILENKSERISAGVEGVWEEWDYSSVAYMARSRSDFWQQSLSSSYSSIGLSSAQTWSNDNYANALKPLDASNPLTSALESLRSTALQQQGETNIQAWHFKASRALAERHGQDVLMGLGLDWRRESAQMAYITTPGRNFENHRSVAAAFGELQLPVTESWEVDLGLRSDRYSDAGVTHNGKIFSRWLIDPQWTMRGSLGTGFRAPSLAQTVTLASPYPWGASLVPMVCNADMQSLAASLGAKCVASQSTTVLGNGNAALKPEKSVQMTWGLAFMPQRNLRLSADFWAVKIKDGLQTQSDELVMHNPLAYVNNFTVNPSNGTLALFLPMQNLGVIEKAGIDLEAQWRRPSDWGRWSLQSRATYMLRSRQQSTPESPMTSDLGRYDTANTSVTPRLRLQTIGGATWTDTSAYLILNYASSYQDAPVTATNLETLKQETVNRRVSSFTTLDFQFRKSLSKAVDARLGVRNVFNVQAPQSFAQMSISLFGANPVYSNLWGRTLEIGVTARF